jgi:hypothetical protein
VRQWRAGALALTAALFLSGVPVAAARTQNGPAVIVRDPGPGRPGRILRAALLTPHVVLVDDSGAVALRRDTLYSATVIVLAPRATVASGVRGDVIVVGGDLFLHPGAVVDGRAIAIGGGVYNSTLAVVHGGQHSYQDHSFSATRAADTIALSYRPIRAHVPGPLYFPGVLGFGLPTYDRANGLAVPWGPAVSLDTGRVELTPTATYRSHLGDVDPSLSAAVGISRRITLTASAGRGTFTNDAWIRSDPQNTVSSFLAAVDTRNYYRADRIEGRVARLSEFEFVEIEPFVGILDELAWSTGPRSLDARTPYSFSDERDSLGMLRPNPEVRRGRISSALVGLLARWEAGDLTASVRATEELPFRMPAEGRFAQTTLDGEIAFDALLDHRFQFFAHAVLTAGDSAPPQRFAYLGGNGTLLTLPLLSLGGDQLLFVESRYAIPLNRVVIPVLGSPTVTFRHLAGGAGQSRLPTLVQNVGVRLTISLLRADFVIDPETRDTEFGVTFAVFR